MITKIALGMIIALSASNIYAVDTHETNKQTNKQEQAHNQDAEIIGWLEVINQAEIDAANVAKSKEVRPEVVEFADLMIKDHTDNLDKTHKLSSDLKIDPVKSSDTQKMQDKAEKKLKDLKKLDKHEFEKQYIDTMIKDHSDALSAVNKKISRVHDKELKKHLQATRMHIEQHLKKAKDIKKDLKKS